MTKTAKVRRKAKARAAKARTERAGGAGQLADWRLVQSAGRWPVFEVLVSREWAKEGSLAQVAVARQAPRGKVVAGVFLVDLGCLGVKSAFATVLADASTYRAGLRAKFSRTLPMMPADFDLAAKIVQEGVLFAMSLGFGPDPDFRLAKRVLDGADPAACAVPVPLGGKEGKPFYIAGPNDDPEAVLRTLERRLGRDGFHFIAPM